MSLPEKPKFVEGQESGDFLSRWSRRKVEAREQTVDEVDTDLEPTPDEYVTSTLTQQQLEELSDEELLEELNLPDPDTMKKGDDFTGFMKSVVPTRLRNRALRRLWLSNPALANVDMLVDYGEDFTDAAMVFPDMKTAYQVGKGIVRKIEEFAEELDDLTEPAVEADEEEVELVSAEEQSVPVSEAQGAEISEVEIPEVKILAGEDAIPMASVSVDEIHEELAESIAMPRRMKFEFNG